MARSRSILLFGILLLIWSFRFVHAWRQAPVWADIPSYRRVDYWVLSARCAQQKNVLLSVCPEKDGDPYWPLEDVSPTDDRGHAFVAELAAHVKRTPFVRADLVRINLVLNALGVWALVALLLSQGYAGAAVVWAVAGMTFFDRSVAFAGPDVPAAFFGIALFALAVPLSMSVWSPRRAATPIAAWLVLGLAMMLRQAIGLIGLVSAALVLGARAYRAYRGERRSDAWAFLVALGLLCTSLWGTSALIALRNATTPMRPSHLIQTHGIFHALYQGLGTVPNPWGIDYGDDFSGAKAVRAVDPSILYGTPAYYAAIRSLYLSLWRQSPWRILGIYAHKVVDTLALPLRWMGLPLWLWVLGLVGLEIAGRRSAPDPFRRRWLVTLALFAGLFLLQGVLISPEIRFLYPVKALTALGLALTLERWLQPIFS